MFLSFFVAILLIVFDQIVKFLTVTNLQVGESARGITNVFDFFYLRNDGGGWGLFSGRVNFFLIITVLAAAYIIYLIFKNRDHHFITRLSYGLILGGAVGNFIDRIRLGYVIDMFRLKFIDFPIFNVADAALTIGVVLLIIVILFFENTEDVL
ncbi:signal peptidase II [Ruoffia sp. FAM 26255]|uniref:signal peptidase II n=1 Tax=Ruoffia sp. FAM 26255 TaxID=3259519 RepID=UPI00388B0822